MKSQIVQVIGKWRSNAVKTNNAVEGISFVLHSMEKNRIGPNRCFIVRWTRGNWNFQRFLFLPFEFSQLEKHSTCTFNALSLRLFVCLSYCVARGSHFKINCQKTKNSICSNAEVWSFAHDLILNAHKSSSSWRQMTFIRNIDFTAIREMELDASIQLNVHTKMTMPTSISRV